MRILCNNLTTIVDLRWSLPTLTEDLALTAADCLVRSDGEITSSPEDAMIEVSDDWHNSISIWHDYTAYCGDFIQMLERFKSMWYGNLCHVTTTNHRDESDPRATTAVHSVVYRAGQKPRDLDKNKIHNMLSVNVIEPAQTGGPLLLCSAPPARCTVSSFFLWIIANSMPF